MIHHLVLFRFKQGATPAQISAVFAALDGLRTRIPGLLSFAGGPYSSPEGMQRGYTHAFVMTFRDAAARDAYLPHPEHARVVSMIAGVLEGGADAVLEFDYAS